MKLVGIYCIRNIVNDMCYVGQSVDIWNRVGQHFRMHDNSMIHNAIAKYGKDSFVVEILELCSESILNDRECCWISALGCLKPYGYNLMTGGFGSRHSEDTRRRISDAQRGKVVSEETRRKMGLASKGRKMSSDARKKMSRAKKGKPWTDAQRVAHKDRKHSEEAKRKVRESLMGNKRSLGYKHTDETKKKMSLVRKGKPWSAKRRASQRKVSVNQLRLFDECKD